MAAAVMTAHSAERRPALDGLRAVAVTLVVLFHCSVDPLAGGFVGVDVFFVLSGYLVTGLLLRGWDRDGRTAFARFYSRRFRRLLPASVVTLLAIVAVFPALVSAIDMVSIERAARAALLYVANWFFIGESTDYFADDVSRNPVLHMWSLAVEEQFYLLWPLLLTGLLVVGRRMGRDPRVVATAAVGLGALASVTAALALRTSSPNRAYFGTDTRAYQLLAGALLALLPVVVSRTSRRPRPAGLLALAGLGAIVLVSTSLVDVDPIVRGVLTTVATVAVIVGLEAAPSGLVARGLSVDPAVYLGQISYGTYLWHWPVVIALGELVDVSTPARVVIVLVVANALASLSFRMLEMPVRTSRRLDRLPGATIVGAGLVVSVVAALVLVPRLAEGGPTRTEEVARPTAGLTPVPDGLDVVAIDEAGYGVAPTCDGAPVEDCTVVEGSGAHLLLMGDSNAEMMVPAFVALAEQEDLTLSVAIDSGCPWQDGFYVLSAEIEAECRRIKDDAYRRVIPTLDPDVVVTMDALPPGTHSDEPQGDLASVIRDSTIASVEALADDGRRRVVLLQPIPTQGFVADAVDPLECLGEATYVEECRFTDVSRDSWYRELLRSLDAESDAVVALDIGRMVCPLAPLCDPVVDGQVVFWNEVHITAAWSESMGPSLATLLRAEGLLDPP